MIKNILIVDDSETICLSLKSLLEKNTSYRVLIAHSKQECMQVLSKQKKIDVALLDLGLPDAPNGEVVDLVNTYNIPSIVLTGSIDQEDTFRDKKIVDYVIKDGSFSFLYAVSLVKRVLNNENVKVVFYSKNMQFANKITKLLKQYKLLPLYATSYNKINNYLSQNKDIKIIILDEDLENIDFIKDIMSKYDKEFLHIITFSEYENRQQASKLLKYGVNQILYKGFTDEEFFSRIKSDLDSIDYHEDIFNKANKDFLTNTYNRRYFFNKGASLYNSNDNIKLFMVDIDKFKNINDTYGHDIGDLAIQEVTKILTTSLVNIENLVARFGGEEFCGLIMNKNEEDFIAMLESIRKSFEGNILSTKVGDIRYTVSIGYAVNKFNSLDDMINHADKGLYKAKNSGRNQVRS
jgi:diguanylate cyclase (GGDEF)-like protein